MAGETDVDLKPRMLSVVDAIDMKGCSLSSHIPIIQNYRLIRGLRGSPARSSVSGCMRSQKLCLYRKLDHTYYGR